MRKNKKGAGRPIVAAAPWGELARCLGGNEKLAEQFGVSKSAVNRWATEVHRVPTLVKKEALRLCKKHGIEEGIEKLLDSTK